MIPRPSERRRKFLYRSGDRYHWACTTGLPGDSRTEHLSCSVAWYWAPRKEGLDDHHRPLQP